MSPLREHPGAFICLLNTAQGSAYCQFARYNPTTSQQCRLLLVPASACIETKNAFSAGNPQRLFVARNPGNVQSGRYIDTTDGQRFVMIKDASPETAEKSDTSPSSLIVVLHWLDDLEQRVPGVR